jgi:hypothetical protein
MALRSLSLYLDKLEVTWHVQPKKSTVRSVYPSRAQPNRDKYDAPISERVT